MHAFECTERETEKTLHHEVDAASTSETSVYYYEATWRSIPEDFHLHTRCRENGKSHSPLCIQRIKSLQGTYEAY
jgi:hypothetical protein